MKNKSRVIYVFLLIFSSISFAFLYPIFISNLQQVILEKEYLYILPTDAYFYLFFVCFFYGIITFGLISGFITNRINFKYKKDRNFWKLKDKEWKYYKIIWFIFLIIFLFFSFLSFDDYIGISKNEIIKNDFFKFKKQHYSFSEIKYVEIKGVPVCRGKYGMGSPSFSPEFLFIFSNGKQSNIWSTSLTGNRSNLIKIAQEIKNRKIEINFVPLNYVTPKEKTCADVYPYIDPSQGIILNEFKAELIKSKIIDN